MSSVAKASAKKKRNYSLEPNPMDSQNFLAKMTWSWVSELMNRGNAETLTEESLYNISPEDGSKYLADKMEVGWDKHVAEFGEEATLWKAALSAFKFEFQLINFMCALDTAFKATQALILGELVGWVARYSDPDSGYDDVVPGVILVCVMSVVSLGIIVTHHGYWFYSYRIGARIKTGITGLVYRKTATLSQGALLETSGGSIINLINTDALKFEMCTFAHPYIWITPVQTCIMLYFLFDLIGISGIFGFIIIVLFLPVQAYQGKLVAGEGRLAQAWADKRLKTMNELISGMRIMKMFAWEGKHAENVEATRNGELTHIRKMAMIRASMNSYGMAALGIYSFGTFVLYYSLGNELTAQKVYGTISIFMLLKWQVSQMFPFSVLSFGDMVVSSSRIAKFLNLSEIDKKRAINVVNKKLLAQSKEAERIRGFMHGGDLAFTVVVSSGGETAATPCLAAYEQKKHSLVFHSVQEPSLVVTTVDLSALTQIWAAATAKKKSAVLTSYQQTANVPTAQLVVLVSGDDQVQLVGTGKASNVPDLVAGAQQMIKEHKAAAVLEANGAPAVDHRLVLVNVENATCSWSIPPAQEDETKAGKAVVAALDVEAKAVSKVCLDNVSFKVKQGEFVGVIGPVGSGKSSLMMSLLGELTPDSGIVDVKGKVSYVAQVPWGFSGTIESNVTCQKPLKKALFKDSCHFAAMDPDIQKFDNGVKTEVGENGITLSGGQKARLGLARALYDEADVYLFDDPLSAVDPGVGRFLFEECMCKHLAGKTRILVTHQLQFLRGCDRIVVFKEGGKLAGVGTYDELQNMDIDISSIMRSVDTHGEEGALDEDEFNAAESTDEVAEVKNDNVTNEKAHLQLAKGTEKKAADKLIQDEKVETGGVSWDVYKKYFSYLGGGVGMAGILFSAIICQTTMIMVDYWLARWIEAPDQSDEMWPIIYALLLLAAIFFAFSRSAILFHLLLGGASDLHNSMLRRLIRAPSGWVDYQPNGRILNRFSADTASLDQNLVRNVDSAFASCMAVLGTLILVMILNPILILFVVPSGIYFVKTRNFYLQTSREVKRLEAVSRSPINSALTGLVNGLVTIRSMGLQMPLQKDFEKFQDANSRGRMAFFYIIRWLGVRLDFLSAFIVVVAGVLSVISVYFEFNFFPAAYIGLALTQTLGLMAAFQWGVRMSAEVENEMTSVERVLEYTDLDQEAVVTVEGSTSPDWPAEGHIMVKDLSLRYDPSLPYVLKHVDLEFAPRQKVGIVGRTGSGKSSFLNTCFFRMVEFEGSLVIDGVDIQKIGLHDLRQRIGVIPQDPTLFSGTVRYNLDPFKTASDEALWAALEQSQMKTYVESLDDGLDGILTEGGSNLSVGQRQLLCLARAIVRNSRILVVDEATANVDLKTDGIIQRNIRETFADCTVLVVAHRLNTIIDSDVVVVFDYGTVVEMGAPHDLLQKTDGYFTSMVQENGSSMEAKLREMAKQAKETSEAKVTDSGAVAEDQAIVHFRVHQTEPEPEQAPEAVVEEEAKAEEDSAATVPPQEE